MSRTPDACRDTPVTDEEMTMMVINAINVQDACNLSGVVHSFSRILSHLWIYANEHGYGTYWVNLHPLSVLFANKITSLSHPCGATGTHDEFAFAYNWACDIRDSKGKPTLRYGRDAHEPPRCSIAGTGEPVTESNESGVCAACRSFGADSHAEVAHG
jgi:hypothetical protein